MNHNRESKRENKPITDTANQLTFSIENLGAVRQGSITRRPLTLFCGPNNSGKTWVMYSLYHYHYALKWLTEKVDNEVAELKLADYQRLDKFNQFLIKNLPLIFNVSPEKLQGARFQLNSPELWQQLIRHDHRQQNVFLMPAERNGLHLFFRELSTRRTALLHHASRENIDIEELLRDVIRSRYAMPIAHYIDWLNGLADRAGYRAAHFHPFAEQLKKQLAGGAYKVEKSTGNISFKPYQTKRDGKATPTLDLHVTSSTVKSLFGLWFYLEYQAEQGDILMIDEPELNVHPENQRKIARLLARLVNAGLRVIISTHSDYIVREFNTLIMLNQNQQEAAALREKHNYDKDETLSTDQVAAYLFDKDTIKPFEVTADDGIYATTFDTVIDNMNTVNNDVYYSLQGQNHE